MTYIISSSRLSRNVVYSAQKSSKVITCCGVYAVMSCCAEYI